MQVWPRDAGLAEALRWLRQSRGLSYRMLARQLGMSAHSGLTDYEHGRRIPPEDLVARYEKVFEIPAGRLQELRLQAFAERADQHSNTPGDAAPDEEPDKEEAPSARPARKGRRRLLTAGAVIAVAGGTGLCVCCFGASSGPRHWDSVSGPGCGDTGSRAQLEVHAPYAPGWRLAASGWKGGRCVGQSLTAPTSPSAEHWDDSVVWRLSPGTWANQCALWAYVPNLPGLGVVSFDVHGPGEPTMDSRIGTAVVNQLAHRGQWVGLGNWPVLDGQLGVRLTDRPAADGARYAVAAAQIKAACS